MTPTSQPSHRTALSVNVNKVALLRNTRHLGIPSVTRAAELCLQAGAQGITVHPRPDERHIRGQDVFELATLMKAWPDREYNIEGNPSQNLMDFIRNTPHRRPCSLSDTVTTTRLDLSQDGERSRPSRKQALACASASYGPRTRLAAARAACPTA